MRILLMIVLVGVLSGCASFSNDVPQYYMKPPLNLGPPAPLIMDDVKAELVVPTNKKEKSYVKIDLESYRSIIENNKRIENYIRECVQRIDAIEDYYTE